jgi:integrase/recombinase XerD
MAQEHTMIVKLVQRYLAVRRAAGYELRNAGPQLVQFGRFAESRGDRYVKAKTVQAWAALARSPLQRERRLQTAITFARFARIEDNHHEVPEPRTFSQSLRRRPTPFIFTDEKVCRLLDAAGRLRPLDSLRSHTYRTLIGLLAATGLRVSEALKLKGGDLTSDGLVIRLTKFRKSRLVPLHRSVELALRQYLDRRLPLGGDHLFIGASGQPLRYSIAQWTFAKLIRSIGLAPKPEQPRPTMHSLRHTFAVRALESCPHDPAQIAHHMVALSTYLGHVHVSSTYWYLQATPKVLSDIADACEALVEAGTS